MPGHSFLPPAGVCWATPGCLYLGSVCKETPLQEALCPSCPLERPLPTGSAGAGLGLRYWVLCAGPSGAWLVPDCVQSRKTSLCLPPASPVVLLPPMFQLQAAFPGAERTKMD